MHYILLFSVAISSAFVQSFSDRIIGSSYPGEFTQFGCTYRNNKFALNTSWPNDPIYSDPRTKIFYFRNNTDYNEFYEHLEENILWKIKSQMLYDDVTPFITMLEQSRSFNSFHEFFLQFVPTYPPPAGDNEMYALLRVYKELVKRYPLVAESFIVGSKDSDSDGKNVEALIRGQIDRNSPPNFQPNGIVGIIPFDVTHPKIQKGLFLIELENTKCSLTVLPRDNGNERIYRVSTKNMDFSYRKYYDYIIIESYHTPSYTDKNGAVKFKRLLQKKEIVYASRSLCSFLQSSEKVRYLNPVRTITRYQASEDEKAAVFVNILQNQVTMRFINDNNEMLIKTFKLSDFNKNILEKDEEFFIDQVQYKLNLEEDEEGLKEKLKRLYRAINNQNDHGFLTTFSFLESLDVLLKLD